MSERGCIAPSLLILGIVVSRGRDVPRMHCITMIRASYVVTSAGELELLEVTASTSNNS